MHFSHLGCPQREPHLQYLNSILSLYLYMYSWLHNRVRFSLSLTFLEYLFPSFCPFSVLHPFVIPFTFIPSSSLRSNSTGRVTISPQLWNLPRRGNAWPGKKGWLKRETERAAKRRVTRACNQSNACTFRCRATNGGSSTLGTHYSKYRTAILRLSSPVNS